MKNAAYITPASLAAAALLVACNGETAPTESGTHIAPPAYAVFGGEWSEPVLLDAAINSPFLELSPHLSPRKLSLYFNTDRPVEGHADVTIWVSQRACLDCPWQPARPLPPPINVMDLAGVPTLSHDGHLLFWSSNRAGSEPLADGSAPSQDIWMATRKNPNDDFGWENPVRLVSPSFCAGEARVNTEGFESPGSYVVTAVGGHSHLYFVRESTPLRVTINHGGEVLSCAAQVTELGEPVGSPIIVRADGLELTFWAPPVRGGLGADFWVSTRRNVTEPWSTPENLGPPINTPIADLTGGLSHDGTTLVFSSGRARGGLGLTDIWISTRTRGR